MTGTRLAGAVALLVLAAAAAHAMGFAAPDQAVDALVQAVKSDDAREIERVLGPGSGKLVQSGDPVADAADRKAFLAAYDEHHAIATKGERAVLHVGGNDTEFPIPLVARKGRWEFDTRAGAQYVLDRRIGRNELDAIETCRAIVDAERDYAREDAGGGGFGAYAQHFVSSPGKKDGLYWPSDGGESPLGPLVATARAEGYGGKHEPYHGYYYRLLTAQGPHAPGGARDYVVKGHMIGGFAVLAYPAAWGNSGIMTFLVGADGRVFEKNLGPETARVAPKLARYDPDASWHATETAAAH